MGKYRSVPQNPLDGSICNGCRYLIKRTIVPFNEAEYGIDREAMGISQDEEIIFEHHLCTETGLDLDHIVLECSAYKKKMENCLIRSDL